MLIGPQDPSPQDPQPESQPTSRRIVESLFSIELPNSWRAMTPDEMFSLEDQLPLLLREVQPGHYYAIGDVDKWLATGFDGRAILVSRQFGEIPIEEESIETIRQSWEDNATPEARREMLEGKISTIGQDDHPAIRCLIRTAASGSIPAMDATEFYVPTSQHLLILSFLSWQDDSDAVVDLYRSFAKSTTFPRPPQGAEELSDRLWNAVFIGALVGLALIALRMMKRR